MKKISHPLAWLSVLLIFLVVISFCLGRYPVPLEQLGRIFLSRILPTVEKTWTAAMEAAVMNIRLPRVLLACLVGLCLSAAGASYQGVFQNPMASPDLLGASSGAAFGAAMAILLGASSLMITFSAFTASILAILLVNVVAAKAHGKKVVNLILAGVMLSSLCSAGTSYVKLVADPANQLPAITYWMMGSLSGSSMKDIQIAAIPMALGLLPLVCIRWRMNLLTLGDDEARAMGVNASRLRLVVVICSTLITAASVAVSGLIGWVGLVAPHLSRKLVGNDYRKLLPASMLMGACFLLAADNVSRNLAATEIPIGILTAFIGTPFFLYLITRKETMV